MTTHRLDPAPDTVTDVFDRDRPPVLTVDPGDTVVVRSLNCSGHLARQPSPGAPAAKLIDPSRGHCLTGPIAVRGAEPGMHLALRLRELVPDDWGFTAAGVRDTPLNRRLGVTTPAHLLWDIGSGTATNQHGHSVPTAPFLGVIGVPPAEPGEHSTIPPRAASAGNVDCRLLTAGSTLYLPVTVPGALLSVGDGHAAQGDGEAGGTAIETGMTTTVDVGLVTDPPLPFLHADTPAGHVTFGFHTDLNESTAQALENMLAFLVLRLGVAKPTALALASTAVHLHVTQIANQTWGTHALLPTDTFD